MRAEVSEKVWSERNIEEKFGEWEKGD